MTLERFNASARAVLASAEAEARALGHLHVGTEHVLLALVAPPPAAVTPLTTLLASHGLDADEVVATVRAAAVRRSSAPVLGTIPYAPRTKKVLELAVQEAVTTPMPYGNGTSTQATPEHLALAILREGESVACGVLERHRVKAASIRALINGAAPLAAEPAALRGPLTGGAKAVARLARQQAGDGELATQDLLLALIEEGDGMAARVLDGLGVTAEAVREALGRMSTTGSSDGPAASATVTIADGVQVNIDDPALVARLQESDAAEVGEVVRRAIEQHLAAGG